MRSESEKKRRNDTNVLLNEIERLVYTSKTTKKVGKFQILDKTCSFIRFYKNLVKGIEERDLADSLIPTSILQDLFLYSQRGFVVAVDNTSQVVCCSSSTMNFLQTLDTEIVGTKLASILTTTDSDYILSLITQRKEETKPFLIHFTMNSPSILRTFICRAFWHQFRIIQPESSRQESRDETGALILTCSSIDKLSTYNLPIFCAEGSLNFKFKVSLDGKFTKTDEAMERYTGYSSADLLGRCLLDFIHWKQTEELIKTMAKTLTQGTNATGCLQFCCKSVSWLWIQADIHVSQNLWNSRIDSLNFSCKALEYYDVLAILAEAGANSPQTQKEQPILPESPLMPGTPDQQQSL